MKMFNDFIAILIRKLRFIRKLYQEYFFSFFTVTYLKIIKIDIKFSSKFYGFPIVYRHPNSKIVIGENISIISDKFTNLFGTYKATTLTTLCQGASISIGNNCGMSGASISAYSSISIGNNVLIGANVILTDSDWHGVYFDKRDSPKTIPVVIGNNVWIGANCIILKGVSIGDNTVIGAGSIVVRSIPSNVIAAGNPCKVIRKNF